MKRISSIIIYLAVAFSTFTIAAVNHIVVCKSDLTLAVISDRNDTLLLVPCCVGANYGQKTCPGDMKTPEGTFVIEQIQNSSRWTHDFNDGAGQRKGAYGPRFLRLRVPGATGIGIHGTCFPESMGSRSSEGCIRLLDDDIMKLVKLVGVGTKVDILPDSVED